MDEIPQLVRQRSQSFTQRLNAIVRHDRRALVGVFRHSIGDAVVEAAVERSKFVYFDPGVDFECQIRDGLTQIAIVVNDLIHRKAQPHQLAPVQRRSGAHLRRYRAAPGRTGNLAAEHGVGGLLDLQRLDQLIKKQWDAVCKLSVGHSWARTFAQP